MKIRKIIIDGESVDGDALSLLTGGTSGQKDNEAKCVINLNVCTTNPEKCAKIPAPKPEVNDSACVVNLQICKTNPDKCVVNLPNDEQ